MSKEAPPRHEFRTAAVNATRAEAVSRLADEKSGGRADKRSAAPGGDTRTSDPGGDVRSTGRMEQDDRTLADVAIGSGPPAIRDVRELGDELTSVLAAVERDCGPLSKSTRKALADHFWCELLAQFAAVIDEADKQVGKVPQLVADRLVQSRQNGKFAVVERKVVESAAKNLWNAICSSIDGGTFSQAKAALPVIRLLALFVCKSPAKHRTVLRHVVDPLRHLFIDRTKEMLREVFTPDWIPGLAQGRTGT